MKKLNNHSPYAVTKGGQIKFRGHPGQLKALRAKERFVLVLAGTQSGKTVVGPYWMMREIVRKGPGDYMIVTPTYPLMNKKALPSFLWLFRYMLGLGIYHKSERIFQLSERGEKALFGETKEEDTKIFFGHAQDPEALESATAKGAWLDEAGQSAFKYESWQAIRRRLSIHEGRVLFTTTPYVLGWLKDQFHDRADERDDVVLIQFDSLENPMFPEREYKKQQEELPRWKFNMMYRGIFERPAGMIFDCFNDQNKVKRFAIPEKWSRYVGVDFGGVNQVMVKIAEDPNADEEKYYVYGLYKDGGKSAESHVESAFEDEPDDQSFTAYGGAPSEDQWRREFRKAGLYIHRPPVKDVEVGIQRLYKLFKMNKLMVFDDLTAVIDDIESYSRKLDENNEPTEKIKDKSSYHIVDGLRYIGSYLGQEDESLSPTKASF